MIQYEFLNEDTGKVVDLLFAFGDAPAIGESIDVDGVRHTRVPPRLSGTKVSRDVRHVSHQLPRSWDGEGPDPAPRRDGKGRPVFHNRREIENYAAKTDMEYDQL